MEEYDEGKLTKQFKENHLDAIEYLKRSSPKDILENNLEESVLAMNMTILL